MERIKNIGQLRELANNKVLNCRIKVFLGGFGKLDITKELRYNNGEFKEWSVFNNEKGIFEHFNELEFKENTCIVEAINKGGLYYE